MKLTPFLALPMLMAIPSPANAAYTLGAFGQYGLLVNNGVHNGDINTAPVNANIGIGDLSGTVNLHNEVVNGFVDERFSGDVSNGAITGIVPTDQGGPAAAVVRTNQSQVQQAITDALGLSQLYALLSGSGTNVTLNGAASLLAGSGALTPDGSRLFTTSTLSIGNGNALTITGSASDYVVIDFTGGNSALNGAVTLIGGITSDHVLFNFFGPGNLTGAANGAAINATILAPNMVVGPNSLLLNGRLFGGASGSDFHFVSNALIDQPGTPPVPEPTTWALMLLGFAAIGISVRYRRPAVAVAINQATASGLAHD